MDTDVLVKEGQMLVELLDRTALKPRGAVWVYSSDSESWRLWIVPATDMIDLPAFYRIVAETISAHRDTLPSLDVGLIDLKRPDHPAVRGLGRFVHMEGVGAVTVANNLLDGFFMPDGVVLRMAV